MINILYCAGAGGNHLANIISTGDNYIKRFDDAIYASPIADAHPDNVKHGFKNAENINLFHFSAFFNHYKNNRFAVDSTNIVITFPTCNDIAHDRLLNFYAPLRDQDFYNEYKLFYSYRFVSTVFNKLKWVTFPGDCIFSTKVVDIISQLKLYSIHPSQDTEYLQSLQDRYLAKIIPSIII